jgi:hypothetical protein
LYVAAVVAGYSGTPLAKKLGIREGMRIAAPGAPAEFAAALEPMPPAVEWVSRVRAPLDLAVAFFTRRAEVTKRTPALQRALGPNGLYWVAWPKRSSGVPTDLTEDGFRELVLPTGWVDTKVCAIDDTWSGLRFVLRKELRPR